MKFFTIADFRVSLEKYLKKDLYSTCKQDLSAFFEGKTIEEISHLPILLAHSQHFFYIKSRISNSNINKGKRGCYRLYFYVDVKLEYIYLIGFYPKTGVYGREDLTKTEEKIMISNFVKEKNKGDLLEHDIKGGFAVIKSRPTVEKKAKK